MKSWNHVAGMTRDWFAASAHRAERRKRARHAQGPTRLTGEKLEDRRMLAVMTVNSDADVNLSNDELTLREAVAFLNDNHVDSHIAVLGRELSPQELAQITGTPGVNDRIRFTGSYTEIVLGPAGELSLQKPVEIDGALPSGDDLTIRAYDPNPGNLADGNSNNDVDGDRVFHAQAPDDTIIKLTDLTLTGGDVDGPGGAVLHTSGSLTIESSQFVANNSTGFPDGGGALRSVVQDGQELIIRESTFDGNYADNASGGAISFDIEGAGSATIEHSLIVNNRAFHSGGGVDFTTGSDGGVLIHNTKISGNAAGFGNPLFGEPTWDYQSATPYVNIGDGAGGGVRGQGNGEITITACTLSDNTATNRGVAAGGIGPVGGSGGGLSLSAHGATVSIRDSTFSGNQSRSKKVAGEDYPATRFGGASGGGISLVLGTHAIGADNGVAEIVNTTVSGNRAVNGGGLALQGDVRVRHSTIVDNAAGPYGSDESFTAGGGVMVHTWVDGHIVSPENDIIEASDAPSFSHTIINNNSHLQNEESVPELDPSKNYSPDIGFKFHRPSFPGDNNFSASFIDQYWNGFDLGSSGYPYIILEFDHTIVTTLANTALNTTLVELDGTPTVGSANYASLAYNGGYQYLDASLLQTHALTPVVGNIAIDTGDASLSDPEFDERGPGYTRAFDAPGFGPTGVAIVDIGAVEFGPVPGPSADFDSDGDVDGADFLTWQRGVGTQQGALRMDGDADLDGDVDSMDLAVWQMQYGQGVGQGPALQPVQLGGDFDGAGGVTTSDYLTLQSNMGMTSAAFSDGDGNLDGKVDALDVFAYEYAFTLQSGLSSFLPRSIGDVALAAQTGTIVVSTLQDELDSDYSLGDLSLREALLIASQTTGANTIVFAESGTISLSSSLGALTINSDVSILGPGPGGLTVSSAGNSRAFQINSGVTATIEGITIADATSQGISNSGNLTLRGVTVRDNGVAGSGSGGGVASTGVLNVYDSTFYGNAASAGGAIYVSGGSGSLVNSTVSDNRANVGGGVFSAYSSFSVANSTLSLNRAYTGSGIYNLGGVTLINTIVSGNLYYSGGSTSSQVSGALQPGSSNNFIGGDAKLGALSDNGGTTLTHAPQLDSPVINGGDNAAAAGIVTDQRGRQRVIGGVVDIGAVEVGGYSLPGVAPRVVSVAVSGSASTHAPYRFDDVVGSGEQLRTVPVGGADTVSISFSEDIEVEQLDMRVVGSRTGDAPSVASFAYDADTLTATWVYAAPLLADQYVIDLLDDVEDSDYDALDGEWVNPASLSTVNAGLSTFPSGDGVAGGSFRFVFTNLPGDFDQDNVVTGADYLALQQGYGGPGRVFTDGDANGDGYVDGADTTLWGNNFGVNLLDVVLAADFDDNDSVNGGDYLIWQQHSGQSVTPGEDGDADGDGDVDSDDLDILFEQFGISLDLLS